jgi:hypothetical protein
MENPKNIVPYEEGKKRLEEIVEKLKKGELPTELPLEEINKSLYTQRKPRIMRKTSNNEDLPLSSKLKPFTVEDAEKTNKRYPDTF